MLHKCSSLEWFSQTSSTLLFIVVLFDSLTLAYDNWMHLGLTGSESLYLSDSPVLPHHGDACRHMTGLVPEQVQLCTSYPTSMQAVSEGAKKGILECQFQFRNERWNCSVLSSESLFGYAIQRGSRETAFIYAIASSGVVHSLAQACSSGNLTECGCDPLRDGQTTPEGWKWSGCSDNIRYASHFARQFVDAPENYRSRKSPSIRSLMNLHNNQAGREAVNILIRMQCRCHGISGSCELKTCWKTLPPFEKVGDYLKTKYEKAIQIPKTNNSRLKRLVRVKRRTEVDKTDLVHIHKSPNYCNEDKRRGILGTSGRVCNKTSKGSDSCDILCCGRGYNTQVLKHMERCQCKFVWCCEVKCKTCVTILNIHTCK